MSEFKKYIHLERWGTSEVENIQLGTCYVFPKIDGTNASLWWDSEKGLQAGSRKRHLTLDQDNAGFYEWALRQKKFTDFMNHYSGEYRLFGEWLVPHTLKTYRQDSYRNFYVFDVYDEISGRNVDYNEYQPLLEQFEIDYIPYIAKITNGSYEQFINQLQHNTYLIEDGKGIGEGIVIKNYDFVNKYGRQIWAKIVTSEFKEKHNKEMGGHEVKGKKLVEEEIANEFVTAALCEKVLAKIENDGGFTSRQIPRLLNTVYYDVVNEDTWNFVKKHKNPAINFKTLQHFVFQKTKENLPQIF